MSLEEIEIYVQEQENILLKANNYISIPTYMLDIII